MATIGGTLSAFHHVNLPSCGSNSSFSIRRILDLPEESKEECPSPSVTRCSRALPLVPRAVPPMVHNYGESIPHTRLMSLKEFGLMPCTHYWGCSTLSGEDQGLPLGIFQKKRRRPMRKTKQRPLFSPHQIQTMEREFTKQRYVTEDKRAQLAVEVNLTETQVKTWFQNRRTKWKKETKDEASTACRCPQEEMEHVLLATQSTNRFCRNICVESPADPFRVWPQH